ncbi:hypothetical protein FIC_02288 [Flavobacteriaceae bacterium 3519-10]|nr:hypothetical protein FIC_02288 [Flavobacteriaceae bacterium 3519-10]
MKKILLLVAVTLLPLPLLGQKQAASINLQQTGLYSTPASATLSVHGNMVLDGLKRKIVIADDSVIISENNQSNSTQHAPAACLTAPNGQYPTTTFSPSCNGNTENITTLAFTGEYSVLNVTTGVSYTFSVSNPAYYITISDNTGTAVLASGTASVVWTSTLTGSIRFYSHADSSCGIGPTTVTHTRAVKCGLPPMEPDYGCDQTYTGTPDVASNIIKNSTMNFAVANDFFVPMESAAYYLQYITADVVPLAAAGAADISSFNIQIMSNSAGDTPGTVIHTLANVVPSSITPLPNPFAGYPTFAVKLNLGNYSLPVNANADTRYWISLQANSASNTSIYWIGHQYNEGWKTKSNYISADGGVTWAQVISAAAPGQHYESNMTVDAECSLAAVNERDRNNVTFYPNPVKDFLTLVSQTKIETVHLYNISGQKMTISPNSRLNMRGLVPGVYIISVILADGRNESFKVIKK